MASAKLKISLLQMNVRLGRPAVNLSRVEKLLAGSPRRKNEIILLPELWGSGYDLDHLAEHAEITPKLLAAMADLARKHESWLGGSLVEKEEDRFYNTFFLLDPTGRIIAAYRKIHLFSLMDEDRHFTPGDRPCLVEIGGLKAGLMTCYDIRFPELARSLTLKGARLLLVCAQWPRPRTAHWSTLLRARALENQLFVAGCNRIGKGPEHRYPGASAIYGPWGETLLRAPNRQGVFSAIIGWAALDRARTTIPCLKDRQPQAY
ncbi:MAG: carbon-nitrogen family hydrolase [Deltaproteobacteria bacterium]|nr:carbon-nitrogen family hydrolase [Deltaproteobacteria bacterium]